MAAKFVKICVFWNFLKIKQNELGRLDNKGSDMTDTHTDTLTHRDLDIMTTAARRAAAVKMAKNDNKKLKGYCNLTPIADCNLRSIQYT